MSREITLRIPLRAKNYLLFGIPYGLSEQERKTSDDYLKLNRASSALRAGEVWMRGDGEPMVYLTCKASYTLKEYLKHTFEANLNESRAGECMEWMQDNGIIDSDDYVILHSGSRCFESDAFHCAHYEEWYPNDESVMVYSNPRSFRDKEEWCQDAADNSAFYCESSCKYFSNDFSCVYVDGQTVCLEYHDDSLYMWESDGEYHWESEPEEDDEDEEGGIPDYHDSPKPWRSNSYAGPVLGCELEMLATGDRADVADIAGRHGLFYERDGSLDRERGIEIIGKPMTLQEHQDKDGKWMRFLRDVQGKAIGWNAGVGYGLHVSVNRDGMSDYATGKMLVFIHDNQELCEGIAGRKASSWQRYVKKTVKDGRLKTGEKYEALAMRSKSRLECRIFRSTLKPEGFLRAVEFVSASVEFCRNASAINLTKSAFIDWLKLPENCATYPNLCIHLGLKKPASDKKSL